MIRKKMSCLHNIDDYLETLRDQKLLIEVEKEVEPDQELAALTDFVFKKNQKSILFKKVKGTQYPLFANAFSSREHLALLFNTSAEEVVHTYNRKLLSETAAEPVYTKNSPSKEVIIEEKDIDLYSFPQTIWNSQDGGTYFTMGVVRCIDEETGKGNSSINRLQIKGPGTLAIYTKPTRGLGRIIWKNWEKKQETRLLITIGGDPLYTLAAVESLKHGDCELGFAGKLKDEPLTLTYGEYCRNIDYPAASDFVFEGVVKTDALVDEGPFCEVNGYVHHHTRSPLMEVKLVTRKKDSVFTGTYPGFPPTESTVIQDFLTEALLYRVLAKSGVNIKKIHFPAGSCSQQAIISIVKKNERDIKKIIRFTAAILMIKSIIITDDDIDITDARQIQWAFATRFSPDSDIHFRKDKEGTDIDPSAQVVNGRRKVTKIAYDLTCKADNPLTRVTPFNKNIDELALKFGL